MKIGSSILFHLEVEEVFLLFLSTNSVKYKMKNNFIFVLTQFPHNTGLSLYEYDINKECNFYINHILILMIILIKFNSREVDGDF